MHWRVATILHCRKTKQLICAFLIHNSAIDRLLITGAFVSSGWASRADCPQIGRSMARGLCFELFFGNLSHCSSSPFWQLFFIWLHLKVHTMAKSTVYIAVKMKRILHCNNLSLMSWKLCVSRSDSQWLCYCSSWSHLQYEVIWWVCLMWNWLIVSIK